MTICVAILGRGRGCWRRCGGRWGGSFGRLGGVRAEFFSAVVGDLIGGVGAYLLQR
jgi:hypothetical protein